MDSSKGRFNAHDWWRNDISGNGLLTKEGNGTLTLTGNNSYSGGTLVKDGKLEAESVSAFGTGDVYVENGIISVDADCTLELNGNFTIDDGILYVYMDDNKSQINAEGIVYLDGGDLNLDFSNYHVDNAEVEIISAERVIGKFDSVSAKGYSVNVTYNDNSVIVTAEKLSSN